MTPTLSGRLQTRVFALATVGVIWTLVVSPFLPSVGDAALGDIYEVTFGVLLAVGLLGLLWELLYHFLQQFRWEKDWPTLFGFFTGFNEGLLLWLLISSDSISWIDAEVSLSTFLVHFATTWLVVWLFLNGPFRVILPRWRFRGGEIL